MILREAGRSGLAREKAAAMKLAIVVPVLNEAPGIAAALAPLQSLRRAGHTVIMVDGGSSDATPTLAAPLADRVIAAPRGRAHQMNAGAASAGGDILLFLHADTRLPENVSEAITSALGGHAWGRFDVRITGRPFLLRVIAALMNLRSRLTGIATGDQAIFVPRRLRRGGRLPGSAADGRHRTLETPEMLRTARLPRRAGDNLWAALGAARCLAHHPAHVAAAFRLLARCAGGAADGALLPRRIK